MALIYLNQPLPEAWLLGLEREQSLLIGRAGDAVPDHTIRAELAHVEAILSTLTLRIDESLLKQMPGLRIVSNVAVGVNNIDLDACTARGIPVGHTPGLLTAATADLALALLLAVARQLPQASRDARAGRWTVWEPTGWLGVELTGATLGMIGLGRIGQAAAARARAFGMNIVYHTRTRKPEAEAALDAAYLSFNELLQTSDFVMLLVPLTAETRGLIDAAALRQMKPGAYLLNISRGPVVVTDDLVRALEEGWLAGAGLDVTDPEPLPPEHPLFSLPNCFIVPHIGSATAVTRRRMVEMAVANLRAGLANKPLLHQANASLTFPAG